MSWSGEERRAYPSITKIDLEEVIATAMERHLSSDSHQFVQTLMIKEQRKQELWEAIKKHVFGWAAVAVIGFIAVSLWNETIDILTSLLKGK